MMTNLDKNILIIKWLDWEILTSESCPSFKYIKNEFFNGGIEFLNFESDSNLQWLCLEKIADERNKTILGVLEILSYTLQSQFKTIKTKEDLFEAIINYIN